MSWSDPFTWKIIAGIVTGSIISETVRAWWRSRR